MQHVIQIGLAIILFGVTPAHAQTPENDQALIEQAIDRWYRAWEIEDPKLAAQDYTEDADWTNAFGMSRKGRAEIENQLTEVFAMSFVMSGQSRIVDQSVRFLGQDVALVTTSVERSGQKSPSGESIGVRHTNHLRVFTKSKGNWKIVSHLISDARDREGTAH